MDPKAFPSYGSMGEVVQEGMTLRDYFAAAALQGHLASDRTRGTYQLCAKQAYQYADAMLAQRNKR
jgi:hypothetical protein